MALERCVTEMGMGVDVHGRDYTLAARRAVSDAIRHSSLSLFRILGKTRDDMRIRVVVGVPASELPYGSVTVSTQEGGLEVPNVDGSDAIVIANAAILVHFDMP